MGRKLTQNVFLPNPDSTVGPLIAFLAGDELPEWAQELVGDHVYEKPKEKVETKKGKIPSVPKKEEEPAEFEVPLAKASLPAWKSFAKKAYKLEGFPQNITREEVIAEILRVDPSLEIREA